MLTSSAVSEWAQVQFRDRPFVIRQRFASRWARSIVYAALFFIPGLIVLTMIFVKLTGKGGDLQWGGVVLCGGAMLLPPFVIVLLGMIVQQTIVKSLDVHGVTVSMGRKFPWDSLSYVDHVTKVSRAGHVTRRVPDNQIELVFANGKAVIPPLIHDREQVWRLIGTMPAEVRDDGVVRTGFQSNTDREDAVMRALGLKK